jgi:V/A-type H+-transporting ATPase subunit E
MDQTTEKLEGLLYAEAMSLAQQHLEKGREASEQIRRELEAKLQKRRDSEELRYQREAEQRCRQLLQSSRLRLDAELDRLRWTLAQDVLHEVRARLEKLADDTPRYHAVLQRYLTEAAAGMPQGNLVAELNPRDLDAVKPVWDKWVAAAAPGRSVTLAPLPQPTGGGMLVRGEDGALRVDNTFEGRLTRMQDEVMGAIMQALFSEADET